MITEIQFVLALFAPHLLYRDTCPSTHQGASAPLTSSVPSLYACESGRRLRPLQSAARAQNNSLYLFRVWPALPDSPGTLCSGELTCRCGLKL